MLNGSKQNRKELSKQEIHREKAAKDFCKKMLKKISAYRKSFLKCVLYNFNYILKLTLVAKEIQLKTLYDKKIEKTIYCDFHCILYCTEQ